MAMQFKSYADQVSDGAKAGWLNKISNQLLKLPRPVKRSVLIATDFIMAIVCLFLAISLRYGKLDNHIGILALCLYAVIPILGLYLIGFYKGVARAFFEGLMGRVLQLFLMLIIIYEGLLSLDYMPEIPRSAPIIFLFLFFIWLWNSRLTIKELLMRGQGKSLKLSKDYSGYDNVLIYGAGEAGRELLEGLKNSHKYHVSAFIDDDPQLTGAYVFGKRIYAAHELLDVVNKLKIAQIFLAMPSISRNRRREIIDSLADISIKIKALPSLQEIADDQVTVSSMRKIDILDVLDRQTVEPDQTLLQKNITGKFVLVTGAGGSIGSELCRQILKNKPKSLVLYELSEFALYSIHQELLLKQSNNPDYKDIKITAILGNVINEDHLTKTFKHYKIQTVYHAAAYKHVPIVEFNPFAGAINNSKGTYHCARAAIKADVTTFVLISTDKAVRPTNIMGASKRLAELVCQGLSQSQSTTCISMVRFGNVLGSSGSVVPVFTKQIEQGRPITVTHPEVTRYFMTIPEAANLVIQAGAMAKGSEVFVLDMGDPVKIVDLARRMIFLSGCIPKDNKNPNGDIEIKFTGLRPGEKLYEELIIGEDNVESTAHPLIMQAIEHSFPLDELESVLFELNEKQKEFDVPWLKQQFKQFVDGYQDSMSVDNRILISETKS